MMLSAYSCQSAPSKAASSLTCINLASRCSGASTDSVTVGIEVSPSPSTVTVPSALGM